MMAGVYIKGMEMPMNCEECSIKSWDGEDYVCPFSGVVTLSIGRQDSCPLIPVPDHGRLIDADKLIDRLEKQRTVILHQLPGVHSRTDGYTSEDYVFERNGDMISILRNYAAIIPADREVTT